MIKAIAFDMDGVLIEAKDWHFQALNRALALFGCEISRHDHLTSFDGLPTRRKLQMLSEENKIPLDLHDFINELKQLYTMEIVASQCKPRFNHEYALSRLRARGFQLAVCSNSIRSTIEVMMRRAALDPYLAFVVSNQDVQRAKPDPEMYLQAIARFGIAPSECLVVEDHDNGVRAAVASGAHVMQIDAADDLTYDSVAARIDACNRAVAA
jgi:HAD superfamily hydrolase (TIGR01509 family)